MKELATIDAFEKFTTELDDNFKELRNMIVVLGQDCKDQLSALQVNDNHQMYRRAYVRSVFALIEGVIHRMKRIAFHIGNTLGSLSIAEMVLIDGASFDINDKGEVTHKFVFTKFLHNVRFGFRVYSKSINSPFELHVNGIGWSKLKEAVRVRDRLMHPKVVTDLNVTDAEIDATKKAFDWFLLSHTLCSHLAQKAVHAKSNHTLEETASLDEKILDIENQLNNISN